LKKKGSEHMDGLLQNEIAANKKLRQRRIELKMWWKK